MITHSISKKFPLVRFHWGFRCILAFLFAGCVASATDLSSPELERLKALIAPYVIPADKNAPISSISFNRVSLQEFAAVMKSHGVEILFPDPPPEGVVHLSLRNLGPNRILDIVTRQVSLHWLYDEGRVIIFGAPQDLNALFQWKYAEKFRLQQLISTEERRLQKIVSEAFKEELRRTTIPSFKAGDVGLGETIALLDNGEWTVDPGFQIIPLVKIDSYKERFSYDLENPSIASVLDAVCRDHGLEWRASSVRRITFVEGKNGSEKRSDAARDEVGPLDGSERWLSL